MDGGSTAPRDQVQARPRPQGGPAPGRALDAVQCAAELLSIVAYITATDGPLQTPLDPAGKVSPWHRRLLLKAAERLDVIDGFMRGRVAFLVAGGERGYYAPREQLELAGAALDTCRATTRVVDALLAGRLPAGPEFETMSRTVLAIHPALDAVREIEGPPRDG